MVSSRTVSPITKRAKKVKPVEMKTRHLILIHLWEALAKARYLNLF
jgi:hypothetical protein